MQYITKSCAFALQFDVFEADGLTPADMTGKRFVFTLKKNKTDKSSVLPEQTFVNMTTPHLMVMYDASETADLLEGTYVCALKMYTDDALNDEVWSDQLIVSKGVFHD